MRTAHPPLVGSRPQALPQLQRYDIQDVWWEQRHTIIYRGVRALDGLRVLIKILRDAEHSDPRTAWLQREYEMTRILRAECAAKPFVFENTELGPTLVYAFDGARPLETLATDAPLAIETVLAIGAGIVEAVGALHQECVIHCNLNPTTLWFSREGDDFKILVSEFGCARHPSAGKAASAAPFDELADIRYISPEQTGRVQRIPDHRSDIYSIGIILFRLLTGVVPFRGRNPLHIIDGHLAREPEFPKELLGTLPSGLRQVVLKALAKNPEARYWSASGLLADLLDCRFQWRTNGAIEEFAPGRHDAKGVLRFSRHLYGRERDTATLLEKVRVVQRERPAMLLISGAPGVGKSALLGSLEEFVRNQNGRFVLGKFDQYKRNVPYLALIQSVQQLIEQILSESKKQIEAWRSRILSALGSNARVVTEVIPALELIIGAPPPIAALAPVQACNRFNRVFTNLIQVFAPQDELLCVVMDDMQWADAASLSLLAHVLADPGTRNVLIVGAYRHKEVGPTHPLKLTIHTLMEAGIDVQILHLNEIKEPDVLQLIRDTFNASSPEVRELSQVLHAKTGGNPLYLRQLLHFLCDEGLIAFEYHSGKWVWDLLRIREEGVTQDVLDLLKKRLLALHEDTRTVFAVAACVGSTFDLEKVSIAADRPATEVLQSVMIGVDQGLIVPLKDGLAAPGPDAPPTHEHKARFRFLHDRVQQAAFDCVPSDAKRDFRLLIGLRLMNSLSADEELIPQPDALSNLNYAWELIADEQQKQRAARLNLVAGRRARQSLACQDALGYISVGLRLLDDQAWQNARELVFELHSEALECEYLTGNFAHADQLFSVLVANARSKQEKARTYLTKILLDTSEARYEQAIEVGIEALRLFDVRYLRKPSRLHLFAELLLVRLRMRGRKPQDLNDQSLNDAEKVAALRILVALFPTAYFLSPDLLMFTGLKVVNYSLRHGISPLSAGGFVLYGLGLSAALNDYERGYAFGRFALDLAEKGKDPSITCKVIVIFAQFIKFWRDPIDESFALIERAHKMALEAGDNQYADYAIIGGISLRFSRGCNLNEVVRECEEHKTFVHQSNDAFSIHSLTMWQNCARALQGKTSAPYSLTDGAYDENAAELHYHSTANLTLASYQYTLRLQLACLLGRYAEAVILSNKGEAVIRSAPGYVTVADHYLYRGLAAAEALNVRSANARIHGRVLRHCRARLNLFAANSPRNFQSHEALLHAEFLRNSDELSEGLKQYDRAIELAEAQGFVQLFALANERAALCCIANGQRRLAGWYLAASRAAYDEWGATAKVAWLDREYASILTSTSSVSRFVGATPSRDHRVSRSRDEAFDIAAALNASHIITSEQNVDGVLTHLMQVIRLQSGAETAQLLLLQGDELRLEACATAADPAASLNPSSSAGDLQPAFSPAIVNYVLHTGDDLMLVDAEGDPRFANCSHLAKRRPKSVICSGIRHQGDLLGAIYLEHTQLAGVFNEQKLEWLRILTTELGLTVWSGKLGRYRDYMHKFAPAVVSKELEKNPKSPDLAAKDCDVSIMFADLAGYTRLAELMDRRQLDNLINRAFSRFIDEIHRYGGIVLEFRGDELFVLFQDDDRSRHAWKAASAALAITRAAACLNEKLSDAPLPILMNIGINSGVASVGLRAVEASSGPRWRYGASGTVVNIAARVRELAREGTILMTADSVARGLNDFVLEDIGEHPLKNMMNPVRIYRLIGERSE
jgi:predicted ATPase/class 3 adenylate cyclase